MRTLRLIIILSTILRVSSLLAADGNFLNVAILELPDRYFADIPQKERTLLLNRLSEQGSDLRLDYNHGWLHFYSDSEEPPHGTSMLYLKLLPRKDDTPLVLVHMAKPFADGSTPRKNQTFIFERDGRDWRDVTGRVIPKQADLTMHFSPRRTVNVIEVAAYERFKRRDGRGYSYTFGRRKLDLVWDGLSFQVRKPTNRNFLMTISKPNKKGCIAAERSVKRA